MLHVVFLFYDGTYGSTFLVVLFVAIVCGNDGCVELAAASLSAGGGRLLCFRSSSRVSIVIARFVFFFLLLLFRLSFVAPL
jgi:hypothetical protein